MTGVALPHRCTGKVRDLYAVGRDRVLMVASDRISVFDVVLADEIPDKGRALTALSAFWFEATGAFAPNHLLSVDPADFPPGVGDAVAGRAMLVRAADPVRLECIARGYLFGSAWDEYAAAGTVCGRSLPAGLRQAERLPAPIFTTTTKAEPGAGHDEPLSDAEATALVGDRVFERCRDQALAVYRHAADHAEACGLLLADTKLEFGVIDGEVVIIDELCTPDSSRYWDAESYAVGGSPPSFDKQYARDYYAETGWDRRPPAPPLPPDVIDGTRARYVAAYERLTGRDFDAWPGSR
ncbi:MAG TPA: phosphoribosylaminoimidazolesuccinocarboxamide synthase [Acidimicrobiia bacterium]|nr:phosphoribosylaminoimidazolesuccinocarboxamide synthase [Acidimicrobiia bacterium]